MVKKGRRQFWADSQEPMGIPATWAIARPAVACPMTLMTAPRDTTIGMEAQICGLTKAAPTPARKRVVNMDQKSQVTPQAQVSSAKAATPASSTRRRL